MKQDYSAASQDELLQKLPNRTWVSIQRQATHLGIIRRQVWSDKELEALKTYYKPELSGRVSKENKQKILSLLPNRTWCAIVSYACNLDLNLKNEWSKKEDSLLKEKYMQLNKSDLLKIFCNRTWDAIQTRACDLGVTGKIVEWTEKDLQRLRELYRPGVSMDTIYKALPNYTHIAIMGKAHKIGLNQKKWTKEELNILKTHYQDSKQETITKLLPHKSWDTIMSKANLIGLERHTKESFKEGLVLNLIDEILGEKCKRNRKYSWMKSNNYPLEIDGLYEQHKLAVEYQGIQHYLYGKKFHKTHKAFMEQKERDSLKRILIPQNGYRYLEVKYNEPTTKEYLVKRLQEIGVINNLVTMV